MEFLTQGNPEKPVIVFFHALGVTGEIYARIAHYLINDFFLIMPTSTAFCAHKVYISKKREIEEIEAFLASHAICKIELIVASSQGCDLALSFILKSTIPLHHIFFDGGQFAQINKFQRLFLTPIMYYTIRNSYKSGGKFLPEIMDYEYEEAKPFFIQAGKNLDYRSLKHLIKDSFIHTGLPSLPVKTQKKIIFCFGSQENHIKYRNTVMAQYPYSSFPVFTKWKHLEFQAKDPKGFAQLLSSLIKQGNLLSSSEIHY